MAKLVVVIWAADEHGESQYGRCEVDVPPEWLILSATDFSKRVGFAAIETARVDLQIKKTVSQEA
jgi:hypothetical protein